MTTAQQTHIAGGPRPGRSAHSLVGMLRGPRLRIWPLSENLNLAFPFEGTGLSASGAGALSIRNSADAARERDPRRYNKGQSGDWSQSRASRT